MDKNEVKEGVIFFLWRTQGSTFDDILDFLVMNKVQGYEEESPETLRSLLNEMKDEGLIEERFMVDGTDRVDFALENATVESFGAGEKAPVLEKKWKTNRPSLETFQQMEDEEMDVRDSD